MMAGFVYRFVHSEFELPVLSVPMIFIPLMIICCEKLKVFEMVIGNKLFVYMGKISMEVYLLHLLILNWLKTILSTYSVTFGIYLGVYWIIVLVISILYNKYGCKYPILLKKLFCKRVDY